MKKKQTFAKSDFSPNMLPQNRKQIFRDVMHLHWQKLLLLGMILLIFYIPILLTTIIYDIYTAGIYHAMPSMAPEMQENAVTFVMQLDLIRSIIVIPLLALLSVALSGILRTIRQYAWEENVHIPSDFAKGIRDNFRQTAALSMLAGLVFTLCLSVFYSADAYNSYIVSILSLLPVAISFLLIFPVFLTALIMIPVYSNRLGATLKNAFFVYTRSLLRSLGFLLLCLIIWIPAFVPNLQFHIFGSIFAVLLTPIALLGWTVFCYDNFDKHLNPLVCPELIGKGTFHTK